MWNNGDGPHEASDHPITENTTSLSLAVTPGTPDTPNGAMAIAVWAFTHVRSESSVKARLQGKFGLNGDFSDVLRCWG
jgi:hypothetical protein